MSPFFEVTTRRWGKKRQEEDYRSGTIPAVQHCTTYTTYIQQYVHRTASKNKFLRTLRQTRNVFCVERHPGEPYHERKAEAYTSYLRDVRVPGGGWSLCLEPNNSLLASLLLLPRSTCTLLDQQHFAATEQVALVHSSSG